MLYPESGSLPERLRAAELRHQPLYPGTPQETDPLMEASGSVVKCSTAVQPGSPSLQPTVEEETRLRALGEVVGAWLDQALGPGGVARHRAVRDLFQLSTQMPAPLFLRAVERATKYRIDSVETIRRIALMYLNEDVRMLPSAEVDGSFLERDTYVEGRLTDTPNFSAWDGMMDQDEEEADPGHG